MTISFSIPGAPPPIPSSANPRPQVELAGSGAFVNNEVVRDLPKAPQTTSETANLEADDRLQYFNQVGTENQARQVRKLLDILA